MEKIPFVDLHAQYISIKPEIDAAIAAVISTSSYIGGQHVKSFEENFAAFVGAKYCIGCGNGTDALEILLQAVGVGEGDEVLVPANSWISTSEAVSSVGATPVFVDTNPLSYTINPEKIKTSITAKTKVIIPVHLYGQPAPMDEIMAIAREYNVKVIEDCAQAHGALYKNQSVGTFGHAAAFSFYPGKNLGAYGDAGAMVTNDEKIATQARRIANHGQIKKHYHAMEGRNSRLDGLQAAILNVKLKYLTDWVEQRRRGAHHYNSLLEALGIQLPQELPESRHAYHLYVIQVPNRPKVQKYLHAQGIETSVQYPVALPMQPAYEHMHYQPEDFPVAVRQMGHILSLPLYPELSDTQIEYVCTNLTAALSI